MLFLVRAAALPRRLALAATKHPSPCFPPRPTCAALSPRAAPPARLLHATAPQIPEGEPENEAAEAADNYGPEDTGILGADDDPDLFMYSDPETFQVDEEMQRLVQYELPQGKDKSEAQLVAEREAERDSDAEDIMITHQRRGKDGRVTGWRGDKDGGKSKEFSFDDWFGDKPPWQQPQWYSSPTSKVSVLKRRKRDAYLIRHTRSREKRIEWIYDHCRLSPADEETKNRLKLCPPLALSPNEFKVLDSTKTLPQNKTSRIYISNYPKKRTSEILGMLSPNVIEARAVVVTKNKERYIIARYPTMEQARDEAMRFHNFEFSGRTLQSDFYYGDTKPYPSSLIRFDDVTDKTTIQSLRDAFKDSHPHADTEKIGTPHAAVLSGRADPGDNMALTWFKPGNERSVAFVANVRRRSFLRKGNNLQTLSTRYPNFRPTASYLRHHLSPIVKVNNLPSGTTPLDLIELFGTLVPVRGAFLSSFYPGQGLIEVPTLADAVKAQVFDNYRYGGKFLEVYLIKRHDRSLLKAEAMQQHALPFAPSDKLDEYPRVLLQWALLHRRPIPTYGVPNVWAVPPDEGKITVDMVESRRPQKKQKSINWDLFVQNSEPRRTEPTEEPGQFPV